MANTTFENFTNSTYSDIYSDISQCSIYSDTAYVFKILGYIAIMVSSLTGNLIIIALFVRGRSQTTLDPFIINIAVSEILVPCFGATRELNTVVLRSDAWHVHGVTGDVLCKLVSYMSDVSPIVSIITMCCITVYQFVFVAYFMKKPQTLNENQPRRKRVVLVMIALTWIIAMGFDAHFFHTYKLQRYGDVYYCDGPIFEDVAVYKAYLIATCVIFIVIPFALILILNPFVAYKLREELKKSSRSFPQWQRSHTKKQKRNQILVITIILVFAVCWGPLGVTMFIYTFKWATFHFTCSYYTFHFISLFMAYSNSAINPWIYLFYFVFLRRSHGGAGARSRPLTSFIASFTRKRKVGVANTGM